MDVYPRYFIHRSIVERDFDHRTINSHPIYPPIAAYFLVDGSSVRKRDEGADLHNSMLTFLGTNNQLTCMSINFRYAFFVASGGDQHRLC